MNPNEIAKELPAFERRAMLWLPPDGTSRPRDLCESTPRLATLRLLAAFPIAENVTVTLCTGAGDDRWLLTSLGQQVRAALAGMVAAEVIEADRLARETAPASDEQVHRVLGALSGLDNNQTLSRPGTMPHGGVNISVGLLRAVALRAAGRSASSAGLESVLAEVGGEVARAEALHPPLNSAHEGYSVICEELNKELWEHVCTNERRRDVPAMRREAVEVAAMAVRFIRDVCDGGRGRR